MIVKFWHTEYEEDAECRYYECNHIDKVPGVNKVGDPNIYIRLYREGAGGTELIVGYSLEANAGIFNCVSVFECGRLVMEFRV